MALWNKHEVTHVLSIAIQGPNTSNEIPGIEVRLLTLGSDLMADKHRASEGFSHHQFHPVVLLS